MSMTNFTFGDDIIDSRDVVSRVEEHNDTYNDLKEVYDEALEELNDFKSDNPDGDSRNDEEAVRYYLERVKSLDGAVYHADNERIEFDQEELDPIQSFSREGEAYPDWECGTTLIHEDYFTEYTKQLIKDCWEMPEEMESGNWPWNHLAIDYDAAAAEAKQDYGTIEFEDETYYLRA